MPAQGEAGGGGGTIGGGGGTIGTSSGGSTGGDAGAATGTGGGDAGIGEAGSGGIGADAAGTGGGGIDGGSSGTAGSPGAFSSVSPLVPYRARHTATLLKNGKVLIAGGWGRDLAPIATMELFDPATGMFSAAGTMSPARVYHSATLLANGTVLIVAGQVYGGSSGSTTCTSMVQIYNPDSGTFASVPSLARYQCEHVATSLSDGRVLIVGSYADGEMEVFSPATSQFTKTGSMVTPRIAGHTATTLNDGRVLVVGGVSVSAVYTASAEAFDPVTGSFAAVGNMARSRGYHTATVLPDGKVLIGGGIETNTSAGATYRPNVEIFDPATNTFAPGPVLAFAYDQATATRLLDDSILVVGGVSSAGPQALGQLYDPAGKTFSFAASLSVARYAHTATLLPGGAVLIVGGETGTGPSIVPAEIYSR